MAFMSITAWANDLKDCTISVPNVVVGSANFGTPGITVYYGSTLLTAGETKDYVIEDGFFLTADATTPVMKDESIATLAQLSVGDYYVKFVGKSGYANTTASKKFSVTGKLLASSMITGGSITAQTYTGVAIEPSTTGRLKDGSKTLVEGTDYTVAYSNNINASAAAKITYTGKGDYSGDLSETFTISAKTLLESWITKDVYTAIYNGDAQTPDYTIMDGTKKLVKGTDYTVTVTATAAGTYSPVIAGKGNYQTTADITLTDKFVIEKAGLTIRALPQTKVYDGFTALPETAEGKAYEVLGKVKTTDAIGTISLSTPAKPNVTTDYQITPSVDAENSNYDYNYVPATLTITKRGLTIKPKNDSKVYKQSDKVNYNGYDLIPTLVKGEASWTIPVSDNTDITGKTSAATESTPEYLRGDIKVVREGKGTDEARAVYKDALTISYTATAPVFGNYEVTLATGDFEITGGKIYITALNLSKNYGEADPSWTAVENTNFIVSGLSEGESLVTLPTLTRAEGDNVGKYTITPSGAKAPTGYQNIVYSTATFEIKARPITIVANPQTLKTTDAATALDKNAFEITNKKAGEGLVDGDKASDVFTLTFDAAYLGVAGYYPDAITFTAGAKVLNYDIDFTEGDLYVIDPSATIVLNRPAKAAYTADNTLDNAASVIADAAAAKFTKAQANQYNKAYVGGVEAGDIASYGDDAVLYTAEEAYLINSGLTGALDPATNLTDDQITAYNAQVTAVAIPGPEIAKTYQLADGEADAYNGTLTGALTAGVALGTDADAYNTVMGLTGEDAKDATYAPTTAEVNTYNATLDGAFSDHQILNVTQVAAFNAALTETKVATVQLSIAQAGAYNATLVGAVHEDDVKVPETHTRYTEDTAYDYNATLTGAKKITDSRPFCVTFNDFQMFKEKWYPIVLPFETSVKEISEAFGYAIVNILNEANTDDTKIAFKLHMGKIEANQPFVVKVYEDINMNEVTFGNPFYAAATGKFIVNSAAPEVADASGVKFIGSYSHKVGFDANEAFFSVSASKNDYYWGSASNQTYMAPLSAYFQLPEGSAARTIEFEEPDGTTTAIQAVNVKAEAMGAEGWYTIGGTKLQGAPTQKGVYIQNGKKVIVK